MFTITFSTSFVSSDYFDSLSQDTVDIIDATILAAADHWGQRIIAAADTEITISVSFEELSGSTLATGGTSYSYSNLDPPLPSGQFLGVPVTMAKINNIFLITPPLNSGFSRFSCI